MKVTKKMIDAVITDQPLPAHGMTPAEHRVWLYVRHGLDKSPALLPNEIAGDELDHLREE